MFITIIKGKNTSMFIFSTHIQFKMEIHMSVRFKYVWQETTAAGKYSEKAALIKIFLP